jgi:radical SAM superfamily enzyme YgiQ (UPF0313 family)
MRIMLVQPNSASIVKTVLGTTGVPLGLAYLGSVLREEHEVRIIDGLTLNYGTEELKSALRKYEPDVVGITATTPAIYDAYEVAGLAKEFNPDIKTVIGGPHATFTAKETLDECPALDVVVRNEGELTAKELLYAFEKNAPLKNISGISFRDGGEVKETEDRPFINNLDEIPFPAYDLLPMSKYKLGNHRYGMMMTSRGCPFNCIFCASSTLCGKIWRARSAENVIEELRMLNTEFGVKEIEFMDDTFTLSKRRAEKICDLMIKEGNGGGMDISWSGSAHANTMNRELAEKQKKAGCHDVYIGAESGSQKVLDFIGKSTTLERVSKAVETVKNAGLNVLTSFIIGVPGETVRMIKDTIKFAEKLNPTYAQFTICTPYPGTRLFAFAEGKGLLITQDWRRYTTVEPIMNIPGISTEQLRKLFNRAYISFYLRPRYVLSGLLNRRFFLSKKVFYGALDYYRASKV